MVKYRLRLILKSNSVIFIVMKLSELKNLIREILLEDSHKTKINEGIGQNIINYFTKLTTSSITNAPKPKYSSKVDNNPKVIKAQKEYDAAVSNLLDVLKDVEGDSTEEKIQNFKKNIETPVDLYDLVIPDSVVKKVYGKSKFKKFKK